MEEAVVEEAVVVTGVVPEHLMVLREQVVEVVLLRVLLVHLCQLEHRL